MADFAMALEYVLFNEGGGAFTNNVHDRGGPTRFGCTLETVLEFRKLSGRPPPSIIDIQNLTLREASAIYEDLFWKPLSLTEFKSQAIACAIFDVAVNRGLGYSAKLAQQMANVKVDGNIGPKTIEVINRMDERLYLARFIASVQNGYVQLVIDRPNQIMFLKGWLARSQRLMTLMAV